MVKIYQILPQTRSYLNSLKGLIDLCVACVHAGEEDYSDEFDVLNMISLMCLKYI